MFPQLSNETRCIGNDWSVQLLQQLERIFSLYWFWTSLYKNVWLCVCLFTVYSLPYTRWNFYGLYFTESLSFITSKHEFLFVHFPFSYLLTLSKVYFVYLEQSCIFQLHFFKSLYLRIHSYTQIIFLFSSQYIFCLSDYVRVNSSRFVSIPLRAEVQPALLRNWKFGGFYLDEKCMDQINFELFGKSMNSINFFQVKTFILKTFNSKMKFWGCTWWCGWFYGVISENLWNFIPGLMHMWFFMVDLSCS